jgi:hypothetical protein
VVAEQHDQVAVRAAQELGRRIEDLVELELVGNL